ncbi:exosome complex exonuclease RRP42-like protein [Achlya hypogyna]|uniref:Ribosomal RNA-processing protein 42 n=1 Tax=Achlya hypogyna TaxID=1202772 RepID=A0A1V9YLA6_ACHHY|nr:exosome complex exonuclease RRP42-like protein [Achlya hypogyna]
MLRISPSERAFIAAGIAQDVRADGRSRLERRVLRMENGVLSQSHGSSRVSLKGGSTDVLASVKVEVAHGDHANGWVELNVQCAPSVSEKMDGRAQEEMNVELTERMKRLVVVDLPGLAIVPNKSVWVVYVDVVVFDTSGNLPDVISMAIYSALRDTLLPAIKLSGDKDEEQVIEVDADPATGSRLTLDAWPICLTLSKVDRWFVMDALLEEELCMSAQISVAMDSTGRLCGMQKSGSGALDVKEMQAMIDVANTSAPQVFTAMTRVFAEQDALDESQTYRTERVGFFA